MQRGSIAVDMIALNALEEDETRGDVSEGGRECKERDQKKKEKPFFSARCHTLSCSAVLCPAFSLNTSFFIADALLLSWRL